MEPAILSELGIQGHTNVYNMSTEVSDFINADQVDLFFADNKPEYVFFVGARSGGIRANQQYPAELIRENLLAECHVIHSSYQHGAKKLLYLASSCCYPRDCPQPMKEDSLLTGYFEPTNDAYAMAKIAGITLCQAYRRQYGANFICAIPADTFGPGDDFSSEDSHVIPALIRRMHVAKQDCAPFVEIWGTGTPQRDFIFNSDVADACILLMGRYNESKPINVGGGSAISIGALAKAVKEVVDYTGDLRFDSSKPDGMPMKLLDTSKLLEMEWRPKTSLQQGLEKTYEAFSDEIARR